MRKFTFDDCCFSVECKVRINHQLKVRVEKGQVVLKKRRRGLGMLDFGEIKK